MSYLNPLRLHFAGQYQAATSTVNNDPTHFNNATFRRRFQERQQGNQLNGWWNPRGTANWRLAGCRVTAAWLEDGSAAAQDDPIGQYLVADSDRQVAAKLVDLDPLQQLASQIWGLEVRICDANGTTLLRGQYEPAAFSDIWNRVGSGGGDAIASAMWQSVLTNLEWGDVGQSPFLQQLKGAAGDGLLSIKFNLDGYNSSYGTPTFTFGRITGTIGPATSDEPRHLVLGRHFMTTSTSQGFFIPAGGINFCVAVVNQERRKIYLDLGNALPTVSSGGALRDLGTLSLGYEVTDPSGASVTVIEADIPYRESGWYQTTAGVVELPAGRDLTDDELNAIASNPLVLQVTPAGGAATTAIAEPPSGLYIRADAFVFRLNPGDQAQARLYATKFGQPHPGAVVQAVQDTSQLQGGTGPLTPGTPSTAIQFSATFQTDANGRAPLTITATDPGNPRRFIDGQVYGVRPALEETLGINYPFNPADFISLLVWSAFEPDEPVTWHGSLQPIFQQYANLYPVMQGFMDLSDYDSVCDNRELLLLAFGLEAGDPNSMPVTRDLSAARRQAILRWLTETGPDGKPLKGSAPLAAALADGDVQVAPESAEDVPTTDGKAAAMSRRLVLAGDNPSE